MPAKASVARKSEEKRPGEDRRKKRDRRNRLLNGRNMVVRKPVDSMILEGREAGMKQEQREKPGDVWGNDVILNDSGAGVR